MIRYYFRTTNTNGKLENEFITITAPDLIDARAQATEYCRDAGIKYRMTPIMEEEVTEEEIQAEPHNPYDVISSCVGLSIAAFFPIIFAVIALSISGIL